MTIVDFLIGCTFSSDWLQSQPHTKKHYRAVFVVGKIKQKNVYVCNNWQLTINIAIFVEGVD